MTNTTTTTTTTTMITKKLGTYEGWVNVDLPYRIVAESESKARSALRKTLDDLEGLNIMNYPFQSEDGRKPKIKDSQPKKTGTDVVMGCESWNEDWNEEEIA